MIFAEVSLHLASLLQRNVRRRWNWYRLWWRIECRPYEPGWTTELGTCARLILARPFFSPLYTGMVAVLTVPISIYVLKTPLREGMDFFLAILIFMLSFLPVYIFLYILTERWRRQILQRSVGCRYLVDRIRQELYR